MLEGVWARGIGDFPATGAGGIRGLRRRLVVMVPPSQDGGSAWSVRARAGRWRSGRRMARCRAPGYRILSTTWWSTTWWHTTSINNLDTTLTQHIQADRLARPASSDIVLLAQWQRACWQTCDSPTGHCVQAMTSVGNIPVWWSALAALVFVLVVLAFQNRDWRVTALIGYVGLLPAVVPVRQSDHLHVLPPWLSYRSSFWCLF